MGATSSGIAAAPCTGNPDDDVWYSFTALYSYATITLFNIGSDLAASGARMQLFSGPCGTLVSAGCSGTTNVINATGLNPTSTYYIRVYSAGANPQAGTAWGYKISLSPSAKVIVGSGRMKEVYHQQIISAPEVLNDPWEITYGPDDQLWVTESKGYRVYKIDPTTGTRDTVLNISQGSTFYTAPADVAFNAQFNISTNNPQGGFAGLALHPKFLDPTTPINYVYISYVYSFNSIVGSCSYYTNRLVRFTYIPGTKRLESPVWLCDTLPGGNDHNSQRIFIAPVGGTDYLFYAQGDMGGGQLGCFSRLQKAQMINSYEGKILRFNLVPDADVDADNHDQWIPNTNPYNALLAVQSAVWSIGIRNNQGFAYDTARNILYGSSHGAYSDDEINIIDSLKNYGHPLVMGKASDNNYNGASAGTPKNTPASTCPIIGNETTNASNIGVKYRDPLFTAYPSSPTLVSIYNDIWNAASTPNNGLWPSEAWSGLDLYSHTLVPGWHRSLVAASLKWGRLVRIKLDSAGTSTYPNNNVTDTVSYFGSQNRFRDLAFSPNGKDIYVIMDKSTTTSGPSALFPVVPACKGCLQKYTFLGYADGAGKSTIPTSIDVTKGTLSTCNDGTPVTIDATNNNIWVPITGPDGNIMAEINAMGQNLGLITSSFYQRFGTRAQIRVKGGVHYLDRNMTITPAVTTFGTPVKLRLYISKAEFDTLDADPASGITTGISQLKILKNDDTCGATVRATTQAIALDNAGANLVHGTQGYVLQSDNITGFSSFYFATGPIILPVELLTFSGSLQNNAALLLWETTNESNTSYFEVERSIDGRSFAAIGTVAAAGNSRTIIKYSYTDNDVANLSSNIVYYRLKVLDADGKFTYSKTITILLADIAGKVSIAPNPATHEVKLTVTSAMDGNAQWKIIDNAGRVVMQSSMHVKKGTINNVTIDVNRLSAGLYYISVSGSGIDQKVKLQKL